jgi:hypothetical protein
MSQDEPEVGFIEQGQDHIPEGPLPGVGDTIDEGQKHPRQQVPRGIQEKGVLRCVHVAWIGD